MKKIERGKLIRTEKKKWRIWKHLKHKSFEVENIWSGFMCFVLLSGSAAAAAENNWRVALIGRVEY